jgi:cell division protein FtsX
MRSAGRHIVMLVLAVAAAAAAALCWSQVVSMVEVAPVTEGQPGTVSVVYDPPLMMLAWLLATAAGVLAVLAVTGLRRRRRETP